MYVLALILFHLVGFAAFFGGAVTQQQLMRTSRRAGLSPAVRDDRESLAATVCAKVEVQGVFAQLATGILLVVAQPGYLKQHWLHGKLTVVVVLLVVAHLEMLNARRIVEARRQGGARVDAEIETLKRRHATFGVITALGVGSVLLFVTVLRPYL